MTRRLAKRAEEVEESLTGVKVSTLSDIVVMRCRIFVEAAASAVALCKPPEPQPSII